jgi:hypothetical protein
MVKDHYRTIIHVHCRLFTVISQWLSVGKPGREKKFYMYRTNEHPGSKYALGFYSKGP